MVERWASRCVVSRLDLKGMRRCGSPSSTRRVGENLRRRHRMLGAELLSCRWFAPDVSQISFRKDARGDFGEARRYSPGAGHDLPEYLVESMSTLAQIGLTPADLGQHSQDLA